METRNNHLKQHRAQLREATATFKPPVRLIALNWSSFLSSSSDARRLPDSEILRLCSSRIVSRGMNHQILHPDEKNKHEEVLHMFMKNLQELTDDEVDEVIEMPLEENDYPDPEKEITRQVTCAVEGIVHVLGLEMPSEEKIKAGVSFAQAYNAPPSSPAKKLTEAQPPKKRAPRYYALIPEALDISDILGTVFDVPISAQDSNTTELPSDGVTMWKHLINTRRIVRNPHVTIVHTKSCQSQEETEEVRQAKDLWDRCASLASKNTMFEFKLNSVVWDGRTMALAIGDLKIVPGSSSDAQSFLTSLPVSVRDKLHITVGTSNGAVPPVEAGFMVSAWRPSGLGKNPPETVSQLGGSPGEKGGNGNISATKGIMSIRLKEKFVRGRMVGLSE